MALKSDKPLVWLKGEVKTPPFGEKARIEAGFLEATTARGHAESAPVQTDAGSRDALPRASDY